MSSRSKRISNSSFDGRYVKLPYSVVNSEQWSKLSTGAVKLIIDLLTQYSGHNNGMLSPCYTLMKKRGWASGSLYRANIELQHSGFIVVTKQGYKVRGKATLVATTWNGIDEPVKCQYDEGIMPSKVALNFWCKAKISWSRKPNCKQPKTK